MEEVFGIVPQVIDVVSIVACGPSALACGAERAPGYVIAVNDAYRHVRHDAVLSMDGRWAANRFRDVVDTPAEMYIRARAFNHVDLSYLGQYRTATFPRLNVFECDNHTDTFSDRKRPLQLNGPNSGYCALNLAYQLRPRIVWLFGFDHSGRHFHPESEWRQRGEGSVNTPRKFAEWSASCYEARRFFDDRGILVVNTNKNSMVRAFGFGELPA